MCYNIMFKSLSVILILLVSVHGKSLFTSYALSNVVCHNKDIPVMQELCQKENNAFQEGNKNDNHTGICSRLFDMWFCVARSVPQCFQNYTFFYQSYLHSPHNCEPTNEQYTELQRIRKEGLEKIKVISLDTSTNVSPVSGEVTDSYVTNSEDDEGKEEEEKEKEGDKDKGEGKQGGHSSHTGSNKGTSFHSNRLWLFLMVSVVLVLHSFVERH
ncbi:hypothetical protein SNE40_001692 [Patella caerulea]|uniref:Uncharacterized protein n=1 Tax=Patella caerulea TaxID=87958 RepID=A0AAN8K4I0_PATCE